MLKRVDRFLDQALTGAGIGLFFIALAITGIQVFLRYVLNQPLYWAEELGRLSFLWLVYVGTILAIRMDKHLVVDMVFDMMPPLIQTIVSIFGRVLMGYFLVILIREGFKLVRAEMSSITPALRIPVGYVYFIIPLAGLVMLYYLVFPVGKPKVMRG